MKRGGKGGLGYAVGSPEWKRIVDHNKSLNKVARDIIQKNYAGHFEGGMWFPDEENKEVALNAMDIAAEKRKRGVPPDRAAREAIAAAVLAGTVFIFLMDVVAVVTKELIRFLDL